MADTKLSSVSEIHKSLDAIPKRIEDYTNDVSDYLQKLRKNSLYISEMSLVGVLTCIVLLLIGGILLAYPGFLTDNLMGDEEVRASYIWLVKILGVVMLLISVHVMGKMLFSLTFKSCEKSIHNVGELCLKQSRETLVDKSVFQNCIDNFEDLELDENSVPDDKLFCSITNVQLKEKRLSQLVRVSRIVLPILLFILSMVLIQGRQLGIYRVVIAFIVMFIFNKRLCLLLEYKVGKFIRALMCVPSLIYGIVLFLNIKSELAGCFFLPGAIVDSLQEMLHPFVSSCFVICVMQVITLILAVLFQNYYAERNYLRNGIPQKRRGVHNEWYIIYGIVTYGIGVLGIFALLIYLEKQLPYIHATGKAIIAGIVLGGIWRIISPIWPMRMVRIIRTFWGVSYSCVVQLFVIVTLLTFFFVNGFTFSFISMVISVSMFLTSWITFGIMMRFVS